MLSHDSLVAESSSTAEGKNWSWLLLAFTILALLAGASIAYLVGQIGWLSLVIVSALIAILIAIFHPELALFGLLFVVYTNLSDVLINYHELPSIARPVVVIVFGIILIRAAAFKDRLHGWSTFVFLTILYGLVGSIAMIISGDYEGMSLTFLDYLKDVFIGLEVILLIRTPTTLRHAIWFLLIIGMLMGTLTFYQQLTNTLEDPYWGFARSLRDSNYGLRISGPIQDPNTYAQIMAVLIPLALTRLWSERKPILKFLALWILFLCGFAVVFTYSRGGFLAVVISLLFMIIRWPPRPAVLVGMVTVLVLVFQILPATYVDRISTLFYFLPNSKESHLQDRSFQGRSSENLAATMMFKDHALVGVGAGNFNNNYQSYSRRLGIEFRRDPRSAHSLYLEVAAERGLLGLTVFFVIVGSTFWSLWRAEKRYLQLGMTDFADLTVALSSGITAYLAASLFLHDSYIRYLWVLIGVGWAAASIAEHTRRSSRQARI